LHECHFFLSYARGEDERAINQFFEDLSAGVRAYAGIRPGVEVGFLDRNVNLGATWSMELMDALCRCRTFVALLCPRYVASVHCGREWTVFGRRLAEVRSAGPGSPDALMPLLWLGPADVPDRVHALHFLVGDEPEAYRLHGLRHIIRVQRHIDDYRILVDGLARRIVSAGWLPPGRITVPYEQIPSAFHALA
jgi:hypothetical protein